MAITVNYQTQQIDVDAADAIAGVDLQALNDLIRTAEETDVGMTYPSILDAEGKKTLRAGVDTGLVLDLASPWQLKFEDTGGAYLAVVTGGTLIGGLGGLPVANTPLVTILLESPVDSTRVATTGADENAIATAVEAKVVEGTHSIGGVLRLVLGVLEGKLTGPAPGNAGTVESFSPVTPATKRSSHTVDANGYRDTPSTLDSS